METGRKAVTLCKESLLIVDFKLDQTRRSVRCVCAQGVRHALGFSPRALIDGFEEMKGGRSSWSLPDEGRPKYQGANLDWSRACNG